MHLKGVDHARQQEEKPVNIFIQGQEEWLEMEDLASQPATFYGFDDSPKALSLTLAGRHLVTSHQNREERRDGSNDQGFVTFSVDPNASSGVVSRWNLVQAILVKPILYPNRGQAKGVMRFTSSILTDPVVVVGSPVLTLQMELVDGPEAAVFAYLEDAGGSCTSEQPCADVHYVTEGQVRVAHQLSDTTDGFARSFTSAHFEPLKTGQVYPVAIPLEPIGHRFASGRRIQISLAGADKDNFDLGHIQTTLQLLLLEVL